MRVCLFVVAVFLLLACAGCVSRMTGERDVELTYESDTALETAAYGDDLRARVLRRLMTAGPIGADVTQEGRRLRIVVDETLAGLVDELITWPGTILFLPSAPDHPSSPRDTAGLVPKTAQLPDGVVEHYWEGPRSVVMRAVEQWNTDAEHQAVAEPLWTSSRGEPRYRTRVVSRRARGELGPGIVVGWGAEGALRLRATPKSVAEDVLAGAGERAAAGEREVVVRGRTSLGFPTFEAGAMRLFFGTGIEAYARAQGEKDRLTSPQLPPLRRVSAVGLPPDTALATACCVVPILLSVVWLLFVRRFDRAHPEPVWLIVVTFICGGVAAIPAAVAESALASLTPWLDPRVVTFGGRPSALPLAFLVFTVVVGLCEEGAKLLGTAFAIRRPEFDEPIDGIVYGIVSSLGFAAAENVHYFASSRLAASVVVARSFMSVPAHMFFGSLWGYALGARLLDSRSRVIPYFVLAAAAHGLFDALLSTDGGGPVAVLLNVFLATVFVVLVRRSLRHGIVVDAVRAIPSDERTYFRVGRPKLFLASSVALHLLAFGIVALGGWYQLARNRPTAFFVVGSSGMLALFAIAAYGISATMPLDVVVDEYGVTFAGAARAWQRVRRAEVAARHVRLDCEGDFLLLGPATPPILEALAASIRSRLEAAPSTPAN